MYFQTGSYNVGRISKDSRLNIIHDTPARYGVVTRALHWVMAALFAWQFAGMIVKNIVGRSPLTAFLVGTHASVGTLLMLLLLVRGMWGLYNLGRRPAYAPVFWAVRRWRGIWACMD